MALMDSVALSLYAAADLFTKQNLFGKMTSTGINVCTVQGERADCVIGPNMYAKSGVQVAGDGQPVYNDRIFQVIAGGSFNPGDELTTDANAKAITAGGGDYVNAIALEAGTAGKVCAVMRPVGKPGTTTTSKLTVYAAGGAISPTDRTALVDVDAGNTALTLADGARIGDTIEIIVTSSAGDSTLTIATPRSGTSATWHLHATGQMMTLKWTATGWMIISKRKAGSLTVVVGTTVLTGYRLTKKFNLSVTATVHSTGATKQIPDGDFDGEMVEVRCTVAQTTPVGDIDGNFTTLATAANTTHLTAIDATTDYVVGQWSMAATAYLRISDTGITFN